MTVDIQNVGQTGPNGVGNRGRSVEPSMRVRLRSTLDFSLKYATIGLLAALVIAATALESNFWAGANLNNLVMQYTPIGLVAIGMTYVIITGNFDLSVGAIFLLATLLVCGIAGDVPVWLAMIVTCIVGLAIGTINGVIVTKFNLNSFITTLGIGSIVGGLALQYSHSAPVSIPPTVTGFSTLGQGLVLGIPWAGVLLLAVFLIFGFLLARTVYGRWLYAVGGNSEAARTVGITVNAVRVSTFAAVGALAALAGVVTASNLGGYAAPSPTVGATTALDAFTIVVIGGTSVYGGQGAMWRTASGLAIIAVLGNISNHQGLDSAAQSILKGAILILALALNALSRRRLG